MYDNQQQEYFQDDESVIIKPPKSTPQASMTAFWAAFTSKYPGTVRQILPKNPYAASKSAAEPKGLVSSCSVRGSYEEAKAECKKIVDKIADECRRCNLRYRDPHFDIEWDLKTKRGDCLFGLSGRPDCDGPDPPRAVKRVHQIFEKPKFYIEGPSTSDIRQGLSDDCWFLAALGSLGSKPGLIQDICVAQHTDVGVYGFVFHRDGEWIHTVVDDKLYLRKSNWDESKIEKKEWVGILSREDEEEEEYRKAFQTGSRALYFAGCTDPNETWLPLLEKAFAKAHGDYKSIDGGYIGEAVEDLTGGVATEMFTADIMDTERFWTEELLQVNEKFLFGCATGRFDDWQGGGRLTDRKGIQPSHAYSIMAACEKKGEKLLKIRNPWGQTEWTGPWSDGSPEWNAEWLELLDHKFGNDGIFWIRYSDWLKKFHFLDRTRLFDNSWKITQQWVSLQVPWSADYHATKFTFTLTKKGPVVVVLSQLDDRYWSDFQGQYIFSLHFRINKVGQEDYLVRSHGNYFMKRSVSTEVDLEPGTYDVRMKVSAYRIRGAPTVSDVVKDTVYQKQDKLVRVAMSYDLAHAKGIVIETEEEKQRRAEQRDMDAKAAKAEARDSAKGLKKKQWLELTRKIQRRKRRDERERMHRERKFQQESEDRVEEGPIEGQQLQNGGSHYRTKLNRQNKYKRKSVADSTIEVHDFQPQENFRPEGRWEDIPNNNFSSTTTAQDHINKFKEAFGPQQQDHNRPVYQNYMQDTPQRHSRGGPVRMVRGPPSIPDTVYTYNSSIDSVLDAELFPPRNDIDDSSLNDDDYDAGDLDSDLGHHAADPWNAVCVVGLRLYTQNGLATIKVVRQEDNQMAIGEEIIADGDIIDIAGSQTLVPTAPLDVDDQVKGLSEDVTSLTIEGSETATLLPVQQGELTPNLRDNRGNGRGRRRDRPNRRDRGHGQGQNQVQGPRPNHGQANPQPPQGWNQVRGQRQGQNQAQGPRQSQNQSQDRRQGPPQGFAQSQAQVMAPGLIQIRGLNHGQGHNRHQSQNQGHGRDRGPHQAHSQGRRQNHRQGHGRGFASI